MKLHPRIKRRVYAPGEFPDLEPGASAINYGDPFEILGYIEDDDLNTMIGAIGAFASMHQMDVTAPGVMQEIVRAACRMVEDMRVQQADEANKPREPVPVARAEWLDAPGLVYYMRLGTLCKIGVTTNLRARLSTINPEELLVVEAGDRALEQHRHDQFKALRQHGEWFRYEGALIEHVDSLRAAQDGTAA